MRATVGAAEGRGGCGPARGVALADWTDGWAVVRAAPPDSPGFGAPGSRGRRMHPRASTALGKTKRRHNQSAVECDFLKEMSGSGRGHSRSPFGYGQNAEGPQHLRIRQRRSRMRRFSPNSEPYAWPAKQSRAPSYAGPRPPIPPHACARAMAQGCRQPMLLLLLLSSFPCFAARAALSWRCDWRRSLWATMLGRT